MVRADRISEPGLITSQVIQHLIDDNLVVADLTGRNPNVFYELAVRHVVKKPVVQIIEGDETIPFDVAATRTIRFDHRDLDSIERCKTELMRQIRSVEKDATQVDSPISVAVELQALRQSTNPLEKSTADMLSMLQEIRAMMRDALPGFDPKVDEYYQEYRFIMRQLDEALREVSRLTDHVPDPTLQIRLSEAQALLDRLDFMSSDTQFQLWRRLRRPATPPRRVSPESRPGDSGL